jgi:hypothetical protein
MKQLDKPKGRLEFSYEYESARCHEMMFAAGKDPEEHLAAVLEVLAKIAGDVGLTHVASFAEQSLIALTQMDA